MSNSSFYSWLSELKSKLNIVTVISGYLTLEKKGTNYWGLCPFHHEKTPSFSVSEGKQLYYCFGCKASGDAIRFVQDYEKISFMDAIEKLSKSVGMTVPVFEKNTDFVQTRKYKERLYELTKETAKHYYDNLNSEQGKVAKDYLLKRGFDQKIINRFGLGYSLDFDTLPKYLKSLNFTEQEMLDAGVCELQKNKKTAYDFLGGRLIIPIINNLGDVVAFGGRDLDNKGFAKYKNTRETILFSKSKELYGINTLAKTIREEKSKFVIIVEGYMDVIALSQSNINNTVASMGTALTSEQAEIIKRNVNEVIISYDGDSAGQLATLRGLEILASKNLNVRIISLPSGMDPDEYIKAHGVSAYNALIKKAKSLNIFKLDMLAENFDLSNSEGKANYADAAIKEIVKIRNIYTAEAFLPFIREKTGIEVATLRNMLKHISNKESFSESSKKPQNTTKEKNKRLPELNPSTMLLFALFNNIKIDEEVKNIYPYLENDDQRQLYDVFLHLKENNIKISMEALDEFIDSNSEVEYMFNSEVLKMDRGIVEKIVNAYIAQCKTKLNNYKLQEISYMISQEKDENVKRNLLAQLEALIIDNKK